VSSHGLALWDDAASFSVFLAPPAPSLPLHWPLATIPSPLVTRRAKEHTRRAPPFGLGDARAASHTELTKTLRMIPTSRVYDKIARVLRASLESALFLMAQARLEWVRWHRPDPHSSWPAPHSSEPRGLIEIPCLRSVQVDDVQRGSCSPNRTSVPGGRKGSSSPGSKRQRAIAYQNPPAMEPLTLYRPVGVKATHPSAAP
jgi:hypothetical protein